jgi:hypothetical protein
MAITPNRYDVREYHEEPASAVITGESGIELVIGRMKMLGHDPDIIENRHEICISAPTRYNMKVKMVGNPCACDLAQVDTYIEPLGRDLFLQNILTDSHGDKKIEELLMRQTVHIRCMLAWCDEEMAIGVRIAVKHHQREGGAV